NVPSISLSGSYSFFFIDTPTTAISTLSLHDALPISSAGCRVNGADVSGSYAYHGNGLYSVDYTVGASDTNRAAGQIPFDCRLQRSEEHTSELQSLAYLVCRLLLEKKKKILVKHTIQR